MDLFDFFGNDTRQSIDASVLIRLEKKLDLILDHLGLELVSLTDEVREAADSGQKITAIKLYREQTGVSLAEAKKDIEAYMNHGFDGRSF